jgi:hypothetical protein
MIDESDLPGDWWIDTPEAMAFLGKQLQGEAHGTHALKGRNMVALARADGSDDVLFMDADETPRRFYCVHLTWSKTNAPGYPAFSVFESLAAFRSWWKSV